MDKILKIDATSVETLEPVTFTSELGECFPHLPGIDRIQIIPLNLAHLAIPHAPIKIQRRRVVDGNMQLNTLCIPRPQPIFHCLVEPPADTRSAELWKDI